MKRFKHRNAAPPGGWFIWKDPENGTVIKKPSMMRLEKAVFDYYAPKEKEGMTRAEIEDNACQHTPAVCYDFEAPSLLTQAVTAAKEAAIWVASGVPIAGENLLHNRLEVCNGCPYWGGDRGGSILTGRCGKCGCSGIKLGMETTHCPLGKW